MNQVIPSRETPQPRLESEPLAPRAVSDRLSCLIEVARVINSSLELDQVLEHILTQAREILGAESGSIMLVEEGSAPNFRRGGLRVLAAQGPRAEKIQGRSQSLNDGVAGWVVRNRKPLLLQGSTVDPTVNRVCERVDVRDALCVPLDAEDQVLGVVSLNNRMGPAPFTEEDLALLTALSDQAALAIRNARSYLEMRRQRQTVERLLHEVARAQEEERKRISLLIHDGPAQTMFAALRNAEAARALAAGDSAAVLPVMDELQRTIRQAIDETRAVMLDLRPLSLEDIGLKPALRQYAKQFEQRSGITAEVVHQGRDRRLPPMVESCFYRIVQEALTNVWKHAGAQKARVVLDITEHHAAIEIGDDGRGFDLDVASGTQDQHLGLSSLRDRAELVGGHLSVKSAPTKGTVVRVTVPLAD